MPFEAFVKHEQRKTFQGVFRDREFFIRYLPSWREVNEAYGSIQYHPVGYVKVKAKVSDASESIYTPCRYLLKQVEVLNGDKAQDIVETVSLRGRFCEQAETGEPVVIQGKLEKVVAPDKTHHRVLLGGNPSDYMISLSL
jgi:predicted nucleotidyltransferase